MLWIPFTVFAIVMAIGFGGYYAFGQRREERTEVRKRLSLIELRNIKGDDIPEVLKSELLSDVPPLNKALSGIPIAVRIDTKLRQAGLTWNVGTFVLLSCTFFVVGAGGGILLHWPALLAYGVGILLFLVPNVYVNSKKRRRIKRFTMHFPDALEMFARSLRAGHSFTGAIQLVAQEMPEPVGPEFRRVFDEQNLGIPLRNALIDMTFRIDSLDAKFFVTAILIQRETGGNLAEIIDKIAHVIRERFRIQGQLKIFTAQARMTGYILSALPPGVAVLINIINPDYMKPLWFEGVGRVMLTVAIVLQMLGVLVIRKIIRIKI